MESYHSLSTLDSGAITQFNITPQRPAPNILPWSHTSLPTHDAAYSHEALKHARRNTFPPMQLGAAAADASTIRFHPTRSPKSQQQEGTRSTPPSKYQSVQCVLCQVALHSNEDIRNHLSTQQHSVAILQHPEVRLQDILIPESFVSEALRKGADPTSEPPKSSAQTSSSPRKRGQVWSSENQQEEINQIHQTSFKISDSEFELAKRMKLDVTPTQSVSHTKPLEVSNHRLTSEHPSQPTSTHQKMSDLSPRYGLGRSDGNVLRYDSDRSESSVPRYEHGRSESKVPRYDSGRSETNIPRYDSGRSKSNVSGYNSGMPNSAGFVRGFPRYDSERPESNVPKYESIRSESNISRYAPERSESNVSRYKKFESNAPTYEFQRSESSFLRGTSGVDQSSKPSSEASRDSGSGISSHEFGRSEASGPKHMPSKPEPQVKETVLHCKVCDIAVPNQFHWEFHAKTKKHLQNMRVLEEAKELEKEEREREKREREKREREKREREEEWRKRVRAEEKKERERMEGERRLKMLEEEKRREKEKRNMEEKGRVETIRQSWRRAQERPMVDTTPSRQVADEVMVNKWTAKVEDSTHKVTSTNQPQDSTGSIAYITTEGIRCCNCNFTIKNDNYWKAHVNSQRHRNRVASGLRTELSPTGAMVDLHESPFHCILCDVCTNDESTFAQHMEGKRHRHNLGLRQGLKENLKSSQSQNSVVGPSSAAVQPVRSVFKLAEETWKLREPLGGHSASRQQSTTTTVQPQTTKPFTSLQTTSLQQDASANTSAQVKEKHSLSITLPQGPQRSEQGTKKGKIIRLKRPWRKNRSEDTSSVVSSESNLSGEPNFVTVTRSTNERHTLQQATSQEHFKVRSQTSSTQLVESTLGSDQRQQSSPTVTTRPWPASTTTLQHQTKALSKAPVHSSTMQQAQPAGATTPSAKRTDTKCKLRQKELHSAGRVESSQRPEPVSTTVSKVIPTGHISHSNTAMEIAQQRQKSSPQLQHRSPLLPMSRRNEFRAQSSLGRPDLDKWEYEVDKAYPDRRGYERGVGSYEDRGVESYEERSVESYEDGGVESYEEGGVESYEDRGVESYEDGGVESYEERGVESYEDGGVESYEEGGVDSYEERGVESYEVEDVDSYGIGGVKSYEMGGAENYEIGQSEEHYRPEDFEGDVLEFEIHPDTPDFDQYQDNTLSFDLRAKLNPKSSSQYSSSETHTRVFSTESQFRKDSSQLGFSFETPQRGFSSTQAPALPRSHNGAKDRRFTNVDSTYSGTSSADLKQSHFTNSVWDSRPPPLKGPRPTVNSPSRLGSLDGGSNSSQTWSTPPAANTLLPSPANWLLTDTAGRLRSVETINYHHGWSQTPDAAQQQPKSGLGTQLRPGFGAQMQQHPLGTAVYQQSEKHGSSAVQMKDGQFEVRQPPAAMPPPGQRSRDSSTTHTWQQEQKQPHVDRFHGMGRSAGDRWAFEHHKFPTTLPNQNVPSQPRTEFPYFSRGSFNTKTYQTF